jgi:hypothetical protein
MLCIVLMVRVHGLQCDSGMCTRFLIVTVVRAHVLYCGSGMFT